VNETNTLPNVAIVGRPNVGKSALFNRLVGRKVAIVHDQPGITRDRISAICTRGTRPFTLWDTGGIVGVGERELSAQVRRAAEQALRDSDVLLFVVDAKEGFSPIDQELARMLRKSQKPVVLVINKIDTDKHEPLAPEFDSLGFDTNIAISAEHDRGISELIDQIERRLPSPVAAAEIQHQTSNIKPPLAIAIVGRPNVGKSSLINSVVWSERAIVSELPGTTRDAIDIIYVRDDETFVFIDTAGIRRRGKQSTSVEIFSVMRAERTIRRADLCVLLVDLTIGVTAQDKRIAGLIQQAEKPAIIILNKWDLVSPRRVHKQAARQFVDETRGRIFFLEYAPVLVTSALTRQNVDRLFEAIRKIQHAATQRIGTGALNRLLRQAFEANPPPLVKGRRLKLLYATQPKSSGFPAAEGELKKTPVTVRIRRDVVPPEFVLFVNDPRLMTETYRRYLEGRIRKTEPYAGLPIIFTLRPRTANAPRGSRHVRARKKSSGERRESAFNRT
jgi:GTP-binding protein